MSEGPEQPPPPAEPAELFDADGRLRPRFVLDFPQDSQLQELVALFERGNFRALRTRAPELAARTEDAVVKAACEELLRRIQPDPTVRVLLGLALAFFAFLLAWAYLH